MCSRRGTGCFDKLKAFRFCLRSRHWLAGSLFSRPRPGLHRGFHGQGIRRFGAFPGRDWHVQEPVSHFLTTHGVTPNAYARELVHNELTTDQLLR